MPEDQPNADESRRFWREKLDEHEKSINTLLMGLSGGLLAFMAQYVKDSAVGLGDLERISAGVAIAGATLSLAIGAMRTWLRTELYGEELKWLALKEAEKTYEEIKNNEDKWAAAKAGRQALEKNPGVSNEDRAAAMGQAYADVYDLRGDAMKLQAETLLSITRKQRSARWIGWLSPVQIISFLLGALAVAAIVFWQLVA